MKILLISLLFIGYLTTSARGQSAEITQEATGKDTISSAIDSTFINRPEILWVQTSITNGFIPGIGYRDDLFGASIAYFNEKGSEEFEDRASASSILCEGYLFIPLGSDKFSIYGSLGLEFENTGRHRTIGGFGVQLLARKKYMIGIGGHTMRGTQVMIGFQL